MTQFTEDWFSTNIPRWTQLFSHLKDPSRTLMWLEIGCFQGRSTVWVLENILKHTAPGSKIYCVDTFQGSVEHTDAQVANMEDLFRNNVRKYQNQVVVHKGPSNVVLKQRDLMKCSFDVVYVDGDHRSKAVLEDAILAFPLLKHGGIMVFDDYMGGNVASVQDCHIGIDCFLKCYEEDIKVIYRGYQLAILKK